MVSHRHMLHMSYLLHVCCSVSFLLAILGSLLHIVAAVTLHVYLGHLSAVVCLDCCCIHSSSQPRRLPSFICVLDHSMVVSVKSEALFRLEASTLHCALFCTVRLHELMIWLIQDEISSCALTRTEVQGWS